MMLQIQVVALVCVLVCSYLLLLRISVRYNSKVCIMMMMMIIFCRFIVVLLQNLQIIFLAL